MRRPRRSPTAVTSGTVYRTFTTRLTMPAMMGTSAPARSASTTAAEETAEMGISPASMLCSTTVLPGMETTSTSSP
jgi:hypothetical protein